MYYQGGMLASGQLTVKMVATSGTPNPGSFTGTLINSLGGVVATSTGTAGTLPSIVLLRFGTVSSGSYQLKIAFNAGPQPVYTISLIV